MTDALLTVDGLEAAYGSIRAVHGVDLRMAEGELVALLGSNGAGKSTTLKSIVGVLKPVSGTIRFSGEDITGKAPEQIVKRGISLVPEGRDVFGALTVEENLRLGAYAVYERKQYQADLQEVFDLFPVLKERFSQPAGQLSGGEQQMLAIARALMSHPKLLMLDEPSLGLSPAMTDVIFDLIVRLNERGATILLVEQNAERALEIVDRAYLFANGRIEFEGTPQQIRERVDVAAVYFGDGTDTDACEVKQ
ncbi:ABC-type branched-chain amino acid transport systems, ATPase component [Coriobacteriaceae bacterium EMTCatB1]|nr:ABC-type branched-chain amino acid transport systems, ATPase component [Coriobacteriaceae bacterium EMTCatB1]